MVLPRAVLPLFLLAAPLQAAEPSATPSTNAEMTAIFEADQKDREGGPAIDWSVVGPRDVQRQERTQQLLDDGALHNADDYYHAAFVFQHGSRPEDYLKAHLLAMAAVALGKAEGSWIAAATLDRYLGSIGQPQVLGTQFRIDGTKATQEPYTPALIPDSLRKALGVRTLAQQEEQRLDFERRAAANPLPVFAPVPDGKLPPQPRLSAWQAREDAPACKALPGVETLATRKDIDWVVVGGLPGTNETPDIFADLVCHLSRYRPVAVALSAPSFEQGAIDNFTASDGGAQARAVFLRSAIWQKPIKDGTSSQANFRLFERLRELRAVGRITAVIAYEAPPHAAPASPGDFQKVFAETLRAQAPVGSEMVVLAGKYGALLSTPASSDPSNKPMASLLPRSATVTLDVGGKGGTMWSCSGPTDCGIKPAPASGDGSPRGLTLGEADGDFSGTLHIGTALTASAPQ